MRVDKKAYSASAFASKVAKKGVWLRLLYTEKFAKINDLRDELSTKAHDERRTYVD